MYADFHANTALTYSSYSSPPTDAFSAIGSIILLLGLHFLADSLNENGDFNDPGFATSQTICLSFPLGVIAQTKDTDKQKWSYDCLFISLLPDIIFRTLNIPHNGAFNIQLDKSTTQLCSLAMLLCAMQAFEVNKNKNVSGDDYVKQKW